MAGPDTGDGIEKKGKKPDNDTPVKERPIEEGHDDYPEDAFGPGGLPEN